MPEPHRFPSARRPTQWQPLDEPLPARPFIKKYASGKSGAAKFTLLVAHHAKGETGKSIQANEVVKSWNKMTGLLGKFNRAHTTRAKDGGWVDSPSHGTYVLLPGWEEALN